MTCRRLTSVLVLPVLIIATYAWSTQSTDLYMILDNSASVSDSEFSEDITSWCTIWLSNFVSAFESQIVAVSSNNKFSESEPSYVETNNPEEISSFFSTLKHDSTADPAYIPALKWIFEHMMNFRPLERRGVSVSVLVVMFGSTESTKELRRYAYQIRSSGAPVHAIALNASSEVDAAANAISSTPHGLFLFFLDTVEDLEQNTKTPFIWKKAVLNYSAVDIVDISPSGYFSTDTEEKEDGVYTQVFGEQESSSSAEVSPSEVKDALETGYSHSWDSSSSIHFSCTFDGSILPMIGAPGGDFGEFFLTLYSYGLMKFLIYQDISFSVEQITSYLTGFLTRVPPQRGYYFHTSLSAVEKLSADQFGGTLTLDDFLFPANQTLITKLLLYVAEPEYIGCRYFKTMMEHSTEFHLTTDFIKNATKAFFSVFWSSAEVADRLIVEVKDEDFKAESILDIKAMEKSPTSGLHPLIRPRPYDASDYNSDLKFYLRHSQAVDDFGGFLVFYFAESYDEHFALLELLSKYHNEWLMTAAKYIIPSMKHFEVSIDPVPLLGSHRERWSQKCQGRRNVVLAIIAARSEPIEAFAQHLLAFIGNLPQSAGSFTYGTVSVVSCINFLEVATDFTSNLEEVNSGIQGLSFNSSAPSSITITDCLNFIGSVVSSSSSEVVGDVGFTAYVLSSEVTPTSSEILRDAVWRQTQDYIEVYSISPNNSVFASSLPPSIFAYDYGTDYESLISLKPLPLCPLRSPLADFDGDIVIAGGQGTIGSNYSFTNIQSYLSLSSPKSWSKGVHGSHLACFEGGDTRGVTATPGGDIAEFIIALSSYFTLSMTRIDDANEALIEALLSDFLNHIPTERRFYFHTDREALKNFGNEFYNKYKVSYLPNEIPSPYHEGSLEMLISPPNVGCSHIRNMLLYPNEYGVDKSLVEGTIKAVFRYIWRAGDDRVLFRSLEDYGDRVAIANISYSADFGDSFPLIPTMRTSSEKNESVLILEHQAVALFRDELTDFFASLPGSPDRELLRSKLDEIAEVQLNQTIYKSGLSEIGNYDVDVTFVPKEDGIPYLTYGLRFLMGVILVSLSVLIIILFLVAVALSIVILTRFFHKKSGKSKGFVKVQEMDDTA